MELPHIFISRSIPSSVIDTLANYGKVDVWEEDYPPPHTILLDKIQGVQGLFCLLTDPIDAEVIRKGSRSLRVISQMAVEFDNIDLSEATRFKIPVGHTPGVLTETCADFTFGLLLASARRIVESHVQVTQNIWKPWGPDVLIGQEVFGSTLGLVGFGRIGQSVARRARGFGQTILYFDEKPNPSIADEIGVIFVPLDVLLSRSDFVSIHTTLTDKTYHLFNREKFAMMKKSSFLINTARGSIIDPEALLWALGNHIIQGAAIDVFETEPIPKDHPLLELPNLIITPHIASASIQTRYKMAKMAAENIIAGLSGKIIPYCVNPAVYD